jgi:hypothetical protein
MSRIASPARVALLLVGALAPFTASGLHAQSLPLTPGEEVRVAWWDEAYSFAFSGNRVVTAEVMAFDGQRLMLRRGRQVFTVPVQSIRRVQRRVGTKPASAPAMVIGSASGFAAGFLLGLATGGIEGGAAGVDRVDAGVTTAVLIGAPAGALIAWAASRSRGIYQDVPFVDMISGLVADAEGRVGLRISVGGR